jgi:hypothetical protein
MFERATADQIARSHKGVHPLLLAKFLYRRYLPFLEPVVRSVARAGLIART